MSKIQYASEPNCVAIFSGGLDSTTLVYHLLAAELTPHLISFDYGQRHHKELEHARMIAAKLNLRHDVIDLRGITHLISNSALTSQPQAVGADLEGNYIEVPEGHYAEDNMKLTVVPNRNMIMISIASAIAVNNNYEGVYTGVHAGDHFVYPDCRPAFIYAVNAAVVRGNSGFGPIPEQKPEEMAMEFVQAPFLGISKEDIAYRALELKVPLEDTWSCYKGGDKHCGKCGTCVERLEAINGAEDRMYQGSLHENVDKTQYEDTDFWRTAVRQNTKKEGK